MRNNPSVIAHSRDADVGVEQVTHANQPFDDSDDSDGRGGIDP